MTDGDYLEAAKQAWADSLGQTAGGVEERRLQTASNGLAMIAIAEGLRALVGVMAAIPIEEPPEPEPEGWRAGSPPVDPDPKEIGPDPA